MAVRIGFVIALVIALAGAGHAEVTRLVSAQAPTPGEMAVCRNEQTRVQTGLSAVFADYQRASRPRSIAVLVDLDARIRALLLARPSYRPCARDDANVFDPRWQAIDVHTGYWNELTYTGRLLVDAHKMDPKSPLRRHTLYSTVFGVTPAHGLGVMPNINAAVAYAKEFPDGPFLRDALETIADFHKDLFMVLRDGRKDYKFDCFAKYITSEPRTVQQARAKRVALEYYDRVIPLAPADATLRRFSDELARGVITAWSFCAD